MLSIREDSRMYLPCDLLVVSLPFFDRAIMVSTSQIAGDAAKFVGNLYRNGHIPDHYYHTIEHTINTVSAARRFAKQTGLSPDDVEIVELAAWFHDAGHVEVFDG